MQGYFAVYILAVYCPNMHYVYCLLGSEQITPKIPQQANTLINIGE